MSWNGSFSVAVNDKFRPFFSVPTKIKDYIKVLIREMWNKIGDNLLFAYL